MGHGIELLRMSIYVFFPVALFYYFNRPQLYRDLLEKEKEEFYPEGNHPPLSFQSNKAEVERLLEEKRKQQEQKPP